MSITLRVATRAAGLAAALVVAGLALWAAPARAQGVFSGPVTAPGLRGQKSAPSLLPNPSETVTTPEAAMPMVMDVRVEGNEATPLDRIRPYVRTRKGRPLDPQMVEEDVRRLHSSKMFVDVRPAYRQVPGGVVLIFQVIERPTLQYVDFRGNEKVKSKKLLKQAGINRGDSADPYAVEEARAKVEDWLREKGHVKAVVTIVEGDKPGDKGAVFMVHEGPIQRVGKISFEGNSNNIAPDGRLQTLIETKKPFLRIPFIFPGLKGYVARDKVDADVETLTNYYRGLGYFQAKIAPELEYDDDQKWATVRYVIYEGVRSKVGNISFVGNTKRTTEEMQERLKLVSGDYFHQQKRDADVTMIQELYGSRGYLFCDVQPEVVYQETPGEVDLVYRLTEGQRCRIGRINVHITGEDPHTRRMTVLNRLEFRPGDVADIRKIRSSERRLKASGIFNGTPGESEGPKITFTAPAEEESYENYAEKPPEDRNRFRGQSPDDAPLPGDQIVELVVHPDNRVEIVPLGPSGESWQTARPVVRGQSPDESATVRFQDMGTQSMPSFDVNRAPQSYGSAYGQPSAVAQPYPQQYTNPAPAPTSAAPMNPRYAPSTTAQAAPQPFAPTQPPATLPPSPPATQWPGAVPPSYSAPTTNPQFTSPTYGAGAAGQPQFTSPAPSYGAPVAQPGVMPGPVVAPQAGVPPMGSGYDTPGQLFGQSNPADWLEQEPTVTVPIDVTVPEGQTGRIMLGVGVNSNAGVVGNIVLDEQNFDWRRYPRNWADIRNATAWRGAGQHFRIEAMPGNVVQRYLVSFTEPYLFDTAVSLNTSGYFFSRQYLNWFEERLGGRFGLGYKLAPDLEVSAALRVENVNISNPSVPTPQQLAEVVGNSNLNTARFQLVHDTRDSPFLPSQGHRLSFAYEQAFGEFSYPRGEFEGSQYFLVRERPDGSGRQTLALISTAGFSGDDTPIFENFFAGGFGSLRGFRFRGASPIVNGVQVGGRFSWLNTVEYMFPITANDALRMVAFVDFGTVEQDITINWDQFRISPGLGVRIAIPALGPAPLAFDFAVPVQRADFDTTQLLNFSVGIAR